MSWHGVRENDSAAYKYSCFNDLCLPRVRNSLWFHSNCSAYRQWQNVQDETLQSNILLEFGKHKEGRRNQSLRDRSRSCEACVWMRFSSQRFLPWVSHLSACGAGRRGREVLKDRKFWSFCFSLLLTAWGVRLKTRAPWNITISESLARITGVVALRCEYCSLEVYLMNDTLCSVAPSASPVVG